MKVKTNQSPENTHLPSKARLISLKRDHYKV